MRQGGEEERGWGERGRVVKRERQCGEEGDRVVRRKWGEEREAVWWGGRQGSEEEGRQGGEESKGGRDRKSTPVKKGEGRLG